MIVRTHLIAEFDDDLLEVRSVCGVRAGSTPGGKPHPRLHARAHGRYLPAVHGDRDEGKEIGMMGWRGCEHTPIDRRCPLWETQGIEKPDWRAPAHSPDARTRLAWALDLDGELGAFIARITGIDG